MPCSTLFGRTGVWLDNKLAYNVGRTVSIKDGYIGFFYYAVVFGCGIALLVQMFFLDKGYYAVGQLTGVSRIQAQAPYPEWSSSSLQIPLPYCSDTSTIQAPASNESYPGLYYIYPPTSTAPNGLYNRVGHVQSERYSCMFLDEKYEITDPLSPEQVFLPTRIVTYTETAPLCSVSASHITSSGRSVQNITSGECTYVATASPKSKYYTSDIESYTLMIQHSVAVPFLDSSWDKNDMESGRIVDINGKVVDPCNWYRKRNPLAACPYNYDSPVATPTKYISVGARGVPDIVSVGTLLEAAGVESLDETGFPLTDSHRYGGITLVVQINYDNYYSDNWRRAKYEYKVQAVRGKVKGIYGVAPAGQIPSNSRYVYERSGIRVMVS